MSERKVYAMNVIDKPLNFLEIFCGVSLRGNFSLGVLITNDLFFIPDLEQNI